MFIFLTAKLMVFSKIWAFIYNNLNLFVDLTY